LRDRPAHGAARTLASPISATPIATANCPRRVVVGATFRGHAGDAGAIQAEMDRIAAEREARSPAQPHRRLDLQESAGTKAWKLIDAAGCRGLTHRRRPGLGETCNFLLQPRRGDLADIEALGEEVRPARGAIAGAVTLEWEIQRVGEPA
jgi:UDP-N-acetylmuramate dehydrogenase